MDGAFIDLAIKKLQWFLDHPEVTWSGIGNYALELTGGAVFTVASWCFLRKKKPPTPNQFNNIGGEQNINQGSNGIAKQVNNYFGLPLKPRTVFIASLAAAGVISAAVVGSDYFVRKPAPSVTKNSTSGAQAPAVNAQTVTINNGVPLEKYEQTKKDLDVSDAALASFFKILEQGKVPREEWNVKLPEIAFRYKELLLRFEAVTSDDPQVQALKKQAKQAIENGDYDRADTLLNQAKERDRAAVATLKASLAEQQAALEKRQLSEAQSCVEQADLQRLQYRYEKSAQYWQEAAAALPEGHKAERAEYLSAAGQDLYYIPRYAEALHLDEQSLFISREIGDRKEVAKLLNNISAIYHAQGEYGKALDYLEQSLPIVQEIGDKEGEGAMLNNIAMIYQSKGDDPKALKYLEQSLPLLREAKYKEGEGITLNNIGMIHDEHGDDAAALQYYEQALAIAREINDKLMERSCLNNIGQMYQDQGKLDAALEYSKQDLAISQQIGNRRGEGTTLNNLAAIYQAKGDSSAALKQYEQALAIAKEIGAKAEEAGGNWNIGSLYIKQGKLAKAEPYLSRAVELGTQLEHPELKDWRKALETVRAKLRGNSARQ